MRSVYPIVALAVLFSGAVMAREAPGIAVGTQAPGLKGSTWVSADGKAPDLKGKVYLVDFWFAK